MNLLEKCGYCNEVGKRWNYIGNTKEYKECDKCKGKGYVLLTKSHLIYKLESLNRHIDRVWNIIKNKTLTYNDISSWEFVELIKKCSHCNSEYEWFEKISDTKEELRHCKYCNDGIIYPTYKECYNHLFSKYITYKNEKSEIINAIKNEEWLDEKYKEYSEERDYGFWWICIKCKYLFDQCSTGCTPYCCNESMCTDIVGFEPINEKVKQWYNNGGYRKNLNYNPKKDYRLK